MTGNFFFSSRRRHTRWTGDWSSDVCSSDLWSASTTRRAVADFAWTLLMATARRVVEADHYARSGRWTAWKWDLLWGADVHGTTLGIVGFGRIGRAVARRALGFNMRVLYHDAVRADAAVERELSAT